MSNTISVNFPDGDTGSTLLRDALRLAIDTFPHVLTPHALPMKSADIKRVMPNLIGEFEVERADSQHRVDIATVLSDYVAGRARLGDRPLNQCLREGTVGEPILTVGTAQPGWTPSVEYGGRTWSGAEIGALADQLREDCRLTDAAANALKWTASELLQGPLDLSGQRFAILGAGAELAPTQRLLQAGARVLWVDRQPPALDPSTFAGTLVHHPEAGDLLTEAPQIHAAVASETAGGPLHLGLYAYAPGGGRELTLTAAMNAIADSVVPASVAILVSPTTPGEMQPEDRSDRERRRKSAPRWQRALARARVLPGQPSHVRGSTEISKSIVGLQGTTYLAAQYLMKMMVAEAWTTRHPEMRVSCNVAGITRTASLEHPLFIAGFLGAESLGIQIFTPEQTRVLNTLMMLHDVLNPDAPGAAVTKDPSERARLMASQSIHGGVRSLPWVFEQTIRVGAFIGLAKRPGLLLKFRR